MPIAGNCSDICKKRGGNCEHPGKRTIPQFARYIISGIIAAGLEYTLFFLLSRVFGVWYILSNWFAMVAGFFTAFALNRTFTFGTKGRTARQFFLYSLLFAVNLALSGILLVFLSGIAGIPHLVSKAITMGLIALWNYTIYRKIVFK